MRVARRLATQWKHYVTHEHTSDRPLDPYICRNIPKASLFLTTQPPREGEVTELGDWGEIVLILWYDRFVLFRWPSVILRHEPASDAYPRVVVRACIGYNFHRTIKIFRDAILEIFSRALSSVLALINTRFPGRIVSDVSVSVGATSEYPECYDGAAGSRKWRARMENTGRRRVGYITYFQVREIINCT